MCLYNYLKNLINVAGVPAKKRYRPFQHLKMTLCTSVLWKIFMYLAKNWLEMVVKRTFRPVANFGDQSLSSQLKVENPEH